MVGLAASMPRLDGQELLPKQYPAHGRIKGGRVSPKAHTSSMPWKIGTNPVHTAEQDNARMVGTKWE